MYSIYHIEGVKIGVSKNVKRRVKKQGYDTYEILEEHTDIYEVSLREHQLQREYGYKVDTQPYYKMIKIATKKSCSKGGKLGGSKGGKIGGKAPTKVIPGHMERMRKLSINAVKRAILQFDLDGNFIKEWECGAYAARELGLQATLINAVLKGRQRTTGGYIFKYKEV